MSAILKFDFQKRKTITFFWSKLSKLHKGPIFACDNYIFPKTRGKKNKQWTHSTPPLNPWEMETFDNLSCKIQIWTYFDIE